MKILIAEDDVVVRKLLEHLLHNWGYDLEVCSDGTSAWEKISSNNPPDIAILDWFMPGLTGVEVCQRAQSTHYAERNFIYYMITSATVNKEQIVKALHSGAHDFILKPIDHEGFRMRISVAEKTVKEKRAAQEMDSVLQNYAARMEQLAEERAKQLIHAERMSCLGTMCAGVAHEINNPLSFISGNAQSIQTFWKDLESILNVYKSKLENINPKLDFIMEELPKSLVSINSGVSRISKIVKGLKRYAVKEKLDERNVVNINDCIKQALEISKPAIGKYVKINLNLLDQPLLVKGNTLELEQVIINLLVNAAHAIEGKPNQSIEVKSNFESGTTRIIIDDSGTGIPQEILSKIWEPFFTTKPMGKGNGLGLSISLGIIRDHQGELKAINRPEGGARFILSLPSHIKQVQQNE